MADVAKILALVEAGALSAEEAEQILAALDGAGPRSSPAEPAAPPDGARHLRVEITDHGRRVVNLRVPLNVASLVADVVPGLPEREAERIRQAIRNGLRGPLVDIGTEDGERVLIVSE